MALIDKLERIAMMKVTLRVSFVLFLMWALHGSANAQTSSSVIIDLKTSYGVSQNGIAQAIAAAQKDFSVRPNDNVTIKIPAGIYDLSGAISGKGAIDVSGVQPGEQGRLIIQGAGQSQTTLIMPQHGIWLYGRNVYRVSFIGMHMTTRAYTVSQGHVVSVNRGSVVLDIESGFPSPQDISDPAERAGRYLRRYTDSATNPQMIEVNNDQIPWLNAIQISGQRWQLNLKTNKPVPYNVGDLIGIKSKTDCGAYWFAGGSDIAFIDVKWTQESRGVFRGGIGKVHFANCTIDRAPPINGQTPCLSTPAGGPQIGQPSDAPTTDNVIENCKFIGTGDDSIAFFNASGIIRNNYIADSFARGILLANSPQVVVENNRLLNCPMIKATSDRQ